MNSIRILGQMQPEDDWVHRFRNLGEEAWVRLRDTCDISIAEIDASFDTFVVRNIPREQLPVLPELIRQHFMEDTVFAIDADSLDECATVTLIVDPAFGDALWFLAPVYDTWIVQSERNRAAVEEIRAARKNPASPSLTIWSDTRQTASAEEWRGMLDVIEMHHGDPASSPALSTLNVYGAAITHEIQQALREYEYATVHPTKRGFIALKSREIAQ